MSVVRRHLSYANVMATVAVFLALGGSAYALSLGKNSVKSRNIAKGAVKTADIANKAVSRAKLREGAVPGFALANGSVGADQLSDIVVRSKEVPVPDASIARTGPASCQKNERPVGGGAFANPGAYQASIVGSYPLVASNIPGSGPPGKFDGWEAMVLNPAGDVTAVTGIAYVLCLKKG
jgi:hypothetical protein